MASKNWTKGSDFEGSDRLNIVCTKQPGIHKNPNFKCLDARLYTGREYKHEPFINDFTHIKPPFPNVPEGKYVSTLILR